MILLLNVLVVAEEIRCRVLKISLHPSDLLLSLHTCESYSFHIFLLFAVVLPTSL